MSVFDLIESVAERRVAFVGETIWDKYHFVAPLRGKPAKENILAVKLLRSESYEGGVIAAKRHAEDFCKVSHVTGYKWISKSRWVEENYGRKLFEVQELNTESEFHVQALPECDAIAVTDFGHGFINSYSVEALQNAGRYLAVACQTNAANMGFNLITKYRRADYIVIDEPEARLAAHDLHSPIEEVMRKLADGRCRKMVVTHGRHGAYGLEDGRFVHAPAMAGNIVDTMGAGDAFFAVTAVMAEHGSIDDLLVIGNAAGALKCASMGHRKPVTKQALLEMLKCA